MQNLFYNLLSAPSNVCQAYWQELTAAYNEPHRAYHTLDHIRHLIEQIQAVEPFLQNRTAVYLAAFYHDCIYDPARTDNEFQSGQLARKRLTATGIPEAAVQRVVELIEATRQHEAAGLADAALFLDADLSILGAPPRQYQDYTVQIRMEYSQYPDAVYQAGRAQVLRSFLDKPSVFQTAFFRDRYEAAARRNLKQELRHLSGFSVD
ncbi:MAG: hypothetical protein EOP52_08925 [Sphingobacteriales bacterium]|nr:MAG: hypothetical protein EOP52_08925 [Sphingobacteriales bacterium]